MKLTLYSLKPGFQRMLRPVARWLVSGGVTANEVTPTTCLISCTAGLVASLTVAMDVEAQARAILWILPPVFLVRMALNAIDGMMAREFGQRSALGAYLNELTDVVSDIFMYLPFALTGVFGAWRIVALIILSVISEFAGIAGVLAGASRRYDGPMGKSDRAFVFGALALWIGRGYGLPPVVAECFAPVMGVLLIVTIINRVKKGLSEYAHNRMSILSV
jgi:CDP-diacylglycerol--glycerol-3-phosphate 3-phosphatidyltransferase